MSFTSLGLGLAVAIFASEPDALTTSPTLAPRITAPRCDVWLATPSHVPFDTLARHVADKLGPSSAIELHEWTARSQPGADGWWIRVGETRAQWQIAYLGADGKVELEALPVLDPSTIEADIAGEIALVALSSCSVKFDRAAAHGSTAPEPMHVPESGHSQLGSRRGQALLGATLGLGTLGLVATAVGFGLSFNYYQSFKSDVDNCVFDKLSGGGDDSDYDLVRMSCKLKHERTMRMHWYMSGIGTAGTLVLGTGLVLAIPTAIEFGRGRARRAELRGLAWAGSRGAGLGLSGRF